MFKKKKQIQQENTKLKEELGKIKNYEKSKIEDDFNIFNQLLEQKMNYYETIIFTYNRYKEEKKTNVTTEEVEKHTQKIVSETLSSLATGYLDYLVDKYFSSLEAMIEVYSQRVFMRLFYMSNEYNTSNTRNSTK